VACRREGANKAMEPGIQGTRNQWLAEGKEQTRQWSRASKAGVHPKSKIIKIKNVVNR